MKYLKWLFLRLFKKYSPDYIYLNQIKYKGKDGYVYNDSKIYSSNENIEDDINKRIKEFEIKGLEVISCNFIIDDMN